MIQLLMPKCRWGAPAKTAWRERNVKKQRHVLAERARGLYAGMRGHGLIEGRDAWRMGKRGRDGCGEKKAPHERGPEWLAVR